MEYWQHLEKPYWHINWWCMHIKIHEILDLMKYNVPIQLPRNHKLREVKRIPWDHTVSFQSPVSWPLHYNLGTWQGLLRAAGLKLGQHQNPLSPWSFCLTRSGDGLRICISNQSLETTLWAPTALKGTKSGSARFVEERAEVPFGGVAGKGSSEGSLERTATKWKSLSPVREGD